MAGFEPALTGSKPAALPLGYTCSRTMTGFEPARANAHAYSKGVTSPGEALFTYAQALTGPIIAKRRMSPAPIRMRGASLKISPVSTRTSSPCRLGLLEGVANK